MTHVRLLSAVNTLIFPQITCEPTNITNVLLSAVINVKLSQITCEPTNMWLILWFLKLLESPRTSHMYFSLLWLTSVISKHLWAHKHCTCTDCLCCEYVCVLWNNINWLKNNHNHYNYYTVFLCRKQDYVSSTDRNEHKNYLNSHN